MGKEHYPPDRMAKLHVGRKVYAPSNLAEMKARASGDLDLILSVRKASGRHPTNQKDEFDPEKAAIGILNMVVEDNPGMKLVLRKPGGSAVLTTSTPELGGSIASRKRAEGDAMTALAISPFVLMLQSSLQKRGIKFSTDPKKADPCFEKQAKFIIPIAELEKKPEFKKGTADTIHETVKLIGLNYRDAEYAVSRLKELMDGKEFGAFIDKGNEKLLVTISLFTTVYPDQRKLVIDYAVNSLGLKRRAAEEKCKKALRIVKKMKL
jgi:hypothetical protein